MAQEAWPLTSQSVTLEPRAHPSQIQNAPSHGPRRKNVPGLKPGQQKREHSLNLSYFTHGQAFQRQVLLGSSLTSGSPELLRTDQDWTNNANMGKSKRDSPAFYSHKLLNNSKQS